MIIIIKSEVLKKKANLNISREASQSIDSVPTIAGRGSIILTPMR